MIASQLPGHCDDVISNRLWRHQQNKNRASETRGRCVKLVVFIVIYGFVMSRDEPFLRSLECYFGIFFPRCFATREINTKITLSWALKQFVTRVHTLFSINTCTTYEMTPRFIHTKFISYIHDQIFTKCTMNIVDDKISLISLCSAPIQRKVTCTVTQIWIITDYIYVYVQIMASYNWNILDRNEIAMQEPKISTTNMHSKMMGFFYFHQWKHDWVSFPSCTIKLTTK